MFTDNEMKLSLKQEKYLCMLNRLDAFRLIKLEQSNKISLRLTKKQIDILEKIGDFVEIDEKNKLYKLIIKENFILNDIKGIKQRAYDLISESLNIKGQYRTYDYMKAKRSAVYLEPIRIFTDEH